MGFLSQESTIRCVSTATSGREQWECALYNGPVRGKGLVHGRVSGFFLRETYVEAPKDGGLT